MRGDSLTFLLLIIFILAVGNLGKSWKENNNGEAERTEDTVQQPVDRS